MPGSSMEFVNRAGGKLSLKTNLRTQREDFYTYNLYAITLYKLSQYTATILLHRHCNRMYTETNHTDMTTQSCILYNHLIKKRLGIQYKRMQNFGASHEQALQRWPNDYHGKSAALNRVPVQSPVQTSVPDPSLTAQLDTSPS